ncbi:MAG: LysR family transcriptional regulator [Myxococcota bacterium]
MIEKHLAEVDLNLLVVLDVLLEERSVTRAATRLGRTQPAVSRSLGRLRSLLGDPLLVREGGGLVPTPRAAALAAPVRALLQDVVAQVLASDDFDPARAARRFTVATTDYVERVLLPRPLARIAREAPGCQIVLTHAPDPLAVAGDVDLLFTPLFAPGRQVRIRPLVDDTFVCVVRSDHPCLAQPAGLDLEAYLALPHLLVAPRGNPGSIVDDELAALGRTRHVAVQVPTFLSAPALVAASDLVWTLPQHLARALAAEARLATVPTPLPVPGFTVHLAWHERWQHDPGHAWLRRLLAEEGHVSA